MRFISLIHKNLVRRPMRSALTTVALATAIAAVVALLGIAQGFTRSFGEIYAAHSVDLVVSRQGSADRLSSSVDASFAELIEEIPEVDRSVAILLETMSLEDEGIYGIPTMGIASGSWYVADYELVERIDTSGSQIDSITSTQEPKPRSLMLGIHLAERVGAGAGKSLDIFGEEYLVRAVFRSPSTWENGSMIMPIEELQALTDRRGQATYINVVLKRPVSATQADSAKKKIKALDAKLSPLATSDFVESDTRMQLARAMAWMTSMVALVIGAIGTLNTMLTSVMERTREIGILRAIGWPKSRVVRMILLESCGLALIASLLGALMAVFLTWGLSQAPAARGILDPSISWQVIAQGIALALVIGLLGALLPAWRAARMLPTEAFREN